MDYIPYRLANAWTSGIGALVWFIFPIGDPSLKALVSDAAVTLAVARGEKLVDVEKFKA